MVTTFGARPARGISESCLSLLSIHITSTMFGIAISRCMTTTTITVNVLVAIIALVMSLIL